MRGEKTVWKQIEKTTNEEGKEEGAPAKAGSKTGGW